MSEKVKITETEAVEKHSRRLKGALTDMRAGVDKVTTAPTAKAAEKIDKMKAGLDEAFASGKVKRSLLKVTLEDWKRDMIDKGIPRVSGGIDRAAGKMADFYGKLFSYQNTALPTISKMPDLTKGDTKARMDAWFDRMSEFKYK